MSGRKFVLFFGLLTAITAVGFGLYLNKTSADYAKIRPQNEIEKH